MLLRSRYHILKVYTAASMQFRYNNKYNIFSKRKAEVVDLRHVAYDTVLNTDSDDRACYPFSSALSLVPWRCNCMKDLLALQSAAACHNDLTIMSYGLLGIYQLLKFGSGRDQYCI